ncbi:uncharacterized protein N7483_002715 [Penicillium malachiteum]|uniref:uncharacterized protein n=1 Tax=Penicillium malachiteum TaxID=1324776 RepID=UPI002549A3F3|nr:uncharacterized protein N7483_002715 [Penicillium malachiteum]KAJ5737590.1 hypothetical protein N7483_002715 [Penicillium malachiteum]
MSTPSSSRGPGPGPGSQITASVVKFRCLFTYDLRRKSKRWQDGYLKYHEFNKRVMVYDETGNYVGDHHWRSGEEVQDGDELKLDKGVLIEVGERMSTTQTDLSNMFEKRRSSQASPQARNNQPPAGLDAQAPRPTSASMSTSVPIPTPAPVRSSSQPFRSLNDLLGIRKKPIGPPVSPYEERHRPATRPTISEPPRPERAPKRQRVSSGSINTSTNVRSEVVDLTETENEPSIPPPREALRPSTPSMPPPKERPRPTTVTRPTRPDPPIAKPVQPPSMAPPVTRPLQTASVPVQEHNVSERREDRAQQNTTAAGSRNDQGKPATLPRIPMQRPRNKFMYSTILQQSSASSTKTTEKPSQSASKPAESQ